jgi:hypothetical protein
VRVRWVGRDPGTKKTGAGRDPDIHAAADTLSYPLNIHATLAANEDCNSVTFTPREVQRVAGQTVELTYFDEADTCDYADDDADEHGITLHVGSGPRPNLRAYRCRIDGWSNANSCK